MPLCVDGSGEGVFVEPESPPDDPPPVPARTVRRLKMWRVWYDYRVAGMSLREIAAEVGEAPSTVGAGIARFLSAVEAGLPDAPARDEADGMGRLVPAFGPGPFVPDRVADGRPSACDACEGGDPVGRARLPVLPHGVGPSPGGDRPSGPSREDGRAARGAEPIPGRAAAVGPDRRGEGRRGREGRREGDRGEAPPRPAWLAPGSGSRRRGMISPEGSRPVRRGGEWLAGPDPLPTEVTPRPAGPAGRWTPRSGRPRGPAPGRRG